MADLDDVAEQRGQREKAPVCSRPGAAYHVGRRWTVSQFRDLQPTTITAMGLVVAGLVTWWFSSSAVTLYSMTDLGLASVLPPGVWVALALVTVAFMLALKLGRDLPIVVTIVVTVFMLHGLGVVAEPTMRFVMTWQHVGIIDYLLTHRSVNPYLDAYQNWPGFFALMAFFKETAGLDDLTVVAKWSQLVFNLLYLGPIISVGRSLLGKTRVAWLAVWFFSINNWIGQDYFSPQGLSFFLYLVILAVLLRWFNEATAIPESTHWHAFHARRNAILAYYRATNASSIPANANATTSQRIALFVTILLLLAAVVSSHQLTPYILVLATGALVVVDCVRLRSMPLLTLLATLLWSAYLAVGYLAGHGGELLSEVGSITSILNQNLGDRLSGSAGHEEILHLRLGATALLWLLAALGLIRLVRRRQPAALALGAGAVAPFPILLLQSYGGETLLRVSLFSMPFMAILAACTVAQGYQLSNKTLVTSALIGSVFVATFPFTRYGNERMDWFSPKEVAAVRGLYYLAPKGAMLATVTNDLPWRYTRYADYEYLTLTADPRKLRSKHPAIATGPAAAKNESIDLGAADPQLLVNQVVSRMTVRDGQQSYLIVTRSQKADLDLMGPWSPGVADRLVSTLSNSTRFEVVINNGDAIVFRLREDTRHDRPSLDRA